MNHAQTAQERARQATEDRSGTLTIKPIKNAILVRIGSEWESFPDWVKAATRIGEYLNENKW